MEANVPGLVCEETERLLERRQLPTDLPEALQRPVPHGARRGTVAHLA